MSAPVCYCGSPARLNRSEWGLFWGCTRWPACDGVVGCHPDTDTPLGTLADKETRQARALAHRAFDGLWQAPHGPDRTTAYAWLAYRLGVPADECHIGNFGLERCKEVVAYATTVTPADIARWAETATCAPCGGA